jgi:hypothetical protein
MTGVRALVTVAWAAVLCLAQPSAAEVRTAYPEQRGVPLSEFPRLIELADGGIDNALPLNIVHLLPEVQGGDSIGFDAASRLKRALKVRVKLT